MVISEVAGHIQGFQHFPCLLERRFQRCGDLRYDCGEKHRHAKWDAGDSHLKTDDFFNAEKFPTIKFQSTSFEKVGDGHYKIKGNLTIRDSTKEATTDAVLNGVIPSGKGMRSGWKATLAINRFDYGLKWDRTIETGGLVAGATVNLVLI